MEFSKREAVLVSKINSFSEKLPVVLKIGLFVISLQIDVLAVTI